MSCSSPNVNRGIAWIGSCPTCDSSSPTIPAIQPLSGSRGAVRLPQMMIPKIDSTKNSHDPNLSAILPRSGEKIARQIRPKSVPMADDVVASPIAYPASPRRASG